MTAVDHLGEAARQALELPDEERIRSLRQVRWITYTRAREILGRFEDLLLYPPMHRMPCLLVVGETNNGKTAIVNRFERLHPANDNRNGDSIRVPVLTVQAPPVPEENRFYASILDSLGSPYRASESAARRQIQVLHVLRAAGLRMLIIDEVHHIIAGHIGKQRIFLNVLKYLANELRIPLVGVGTVDAVRAIQTDPQLANRFEPVALPAWELNREFQMLLASFESTLPLRKPSCLADERMATKLLAMSEGTIGELSRILVAAATEAIRSGRERIDEKTLREIDWQPPSERKRSAAGLL
jgi:type II secretory pathway predicted ATPase ExeA